MPAFTDITHGFEPQSFMAEIVDATNERRAAAIASGATGLPDAIPTSSPQSFQGGTVKPTHLLIQKMLEALAPKYVDHDATDPVVTPYTLATWRTAAGINASGFKRATTWANPAADPTFSYGLIQTGDITGYWIWVEIVAGLRALKWTRKIPGFISAEHLDIYENASTLSAAKSAADAAWASGTWLSGTFYDRSCFVSMVDEGSSYSAYIGAERLKYRVTLSTGAPVACTCKFMLEIIDGGHDYYFDFEGLAEDSWNELESHVIAAAGTTATMDYSTMPSPTATPATSSGLGAGSNAGNINGDYYCLLQWSFTHT